MRVRAIRRFFDVKESLTRDVGDEFEVTPQRYEQINAVRSDGLVVPCSYDGMSKTELKSVLEARGIVCPEKAVKADLLKLVQR